MKKISDLIYQDREGNIYKITTQLENLMLKEMFVMQDEIDHLRDFLTDKDKVIDKAIEYVSNLCNYANVEYYSDNQLRYITIRPYYIEELLNILKGEDKE